MENIDESNILKEYLKQKVNAKQDVSEDELVKKMSTLQQKHFQKSSQLDDFLEDEYMEEIEREFKEMLERGAKAKGLISL